MRVQLILLCLVFVSVSQAASLPDTGQANCYDGTSMVACDARNSGDEAEHPGQDGRFGRDAAAAVGALNKLGGGDVGFDYTALDASGNSTNPSGGATPHPCVRDNITGLVWEVKTDDGGLHDTDDDFNWYSTDSATNGGDVGYPNNNGAICYGYSAGDASSYCNTQAFVARVNAEGLCGFRDWRMPSRRELLTIIHYGRSAPAIDTSYFPNTRPVFGALYWSATSVAYPDYAWIVATYHGGSHYGFRKDYYPVTVRLVRGERF